MLHLISGKDESGKDGKGPKSGEYSTTKVNVAKEHKNQQWQFPKEKIAKTSVIDYRDA